MSLQGAPRLKASSLSIRFGGIVALNDVSFEIEPGQIVGLIGPNGAGKTTLLNCISRFYDPMSGQVHFGDVNLLDLHTSSLPNIGIARTFQHLELFESMTVRDNLLVPQNNVAGGGLLGSVLRLPSFIRSEREIRHRAIEILELLDLDDHKEWPVLAIPYGMRKKVDIGRALISKPRLLLLDEPASGMTKEEIDDLSNLIVRLRDDMHVAILLVEHNMNFVMKTCDSIIALDFGRKIANGTPIEIQQNRTVIQSYLGASA